MEHATLSPQPTVATTVQALKDKGYQVYSEPNGEAALKRIKTLIPADASIMNGASVTLEEIGFIDFIKSDQHPWQNLHADIVAETDPDKQSQLRKQALLSEYYLGSVHALTTDGIFLVASNTGSQLPHLAYSSPNLILVVSTKKIVSDLDEAMNRLHEYVIPLEDDHMQDLYGTGTELNKLLIFYGESASSNRNITLVLVEEELGF